MLYEIWVTSPKQLKVYVVDARSSYAAYGNRAKGGGVEHEQYYTSCQIEFGNIDNIHAVREAYKKICLLSHSYLRTKDQKKIFSKIENTGWIGLLKNILYHSAVIALKVGVYHQWSLVHWSDGWDRTAQLWSLSEIMLDPYYRTLRGFEVLIEKEWVSFGHKFESRWGHFRNDSIMPDERSPVFIQFLDAVYQLITQFPTYFQFNTKLLLFLAHHVYSCKFGTFLGDNERTRQKEGLIRDKTTSIWTYVNDNAFDFLNPFYKQTDKILRPNWDYLALEFWKEHFWAFSELTQYRAHLSLTSPEDHKEEIMKKALEENLIMKKRIKKLEEEMAQLKSKSS